MFEATAFPELGKVKPIATEVTVGLKWIKGREGRMDSIFLREDNNS